ncbi:MAG: M23 family metallopeptidase [Patescibacteria group bacterium]
MMFLRWIFSKKHYELKIVLATLGVLFVLPIIAVVVVVSTPIVAVGNALAAVNPITHIVEIFNPNGDKVEEIQLSTTWPTRGYTTDEFGAYGQYRMEHNLGPHTGLDIANEYNLIGEPVSPFTEGKVIKVNPFDNGTCGIYVKVQHVFNVTSLYCHLAIALAVEQQDVKPGDIIGLMGSTGASTGAHLHFQVAVYDIPVNPRTFMVGEPEKGTIKSVLPSF